MSPDEDEHELTGEEPSQPDHDSPTPTDVDEVELREAEEPEPLDEDIQAFDDDGSELSDEETTGEPSLPEEEGSES